MIKMYISFSSETKYHRTVFKNIIYLPFMEKISSTTINIGLFLCQFQYTTYYVFNSYQHLRNSSVIGYIDRNPHEKIWVKKVKVISCNPTLLCVFHKVYNPPPPNLYMIMTHNFIFIVGNILSQICFDITRVCQVGRA